MRVNLEDLLSGVGRPLGSGVGDIGAVRATAADSRLWQSYVGALNQLAQAIRAGTAAVSAPLPNPPPVPVTALWRSRSEAAIRSVTDARDAVRAAAAGGQASTTPPAAGTAARATRDDLAV